MSKPQDLVSVYRAANVTEAHFVKNLLAEENIPAYATEDADPLPGLQIDPPEVFVVKLSNSVTLEGTGMADVPSRFKLDAFPPTRFVEVPATALYSVRLFPPMPYMPALSVNVLLTVTLPPCVAPEELFKVKPS